METIKKLAKAIKEQADGNVNFFAKAIKERSDESVSFFITRMLYGLLWIVNYTFTESNGILINSLKAYDEDGFEVIPEFDEQELEDEANG